MLKSNGSGQIPSRQISANTRSATTIGPTLDLQELMLMFRHFSTFLMGTLFGAALMVGLFHYYLVRDQEGFHLIRKVTPKLNRPYHDIRNFGAEDWQNHPDLGLSLARANRTSAIGESILKPWKDAATQVLPPAGAPR